MIQSCWAPVGSRSSAICGSAKLSTVLSTETSSTGSMSTTSAAQPRQPTRCVRWASASASVLSRVVSHQFLNRPAGIVSGCEHRPCRYDRRHEPTSPRPRERARRLRGDPHRRAASARRRWMPPPARPGCRRAVCSTTSRRRRRSRPALIERLRTPRRRGHRRDDRRAGGPDRVLPAHVGDGRTTRSTARSSPRRASRRAATRAASAALRDDARAVGRTPCARTRRTRRPSTS